MKELIMEWREDINDIVRVRRFLSDSGLMFANKRNLERLIDACDRIQFELEESIEAKLK